MKARINGVEIAFEVTGSGPPVLLVSGTGVGGEIWHREQVPALARDYTCISFDLRGSGDSEAPPGPYTVAQMAEDALALLDHLEIERARCIGLSLGSAILQELALARPEAVEAMVLLSTWSSSPTEHHIRRWFEARMASLEQAPLEVFGAYSFWMWAPSFVDDQPEELAQHIAFFRANSGSQPLHAYVSHFQADLGHDTAARLSQIDRPTLVIHGDEDLITLPRYNRRVAALIPGARIASVTGAGHMALLERPDAVNSSILRFLAGETVGDSGTP
ncbi:MAG: alpha/beta fold hydrolase [Solirubrobacterales bacterium]